MTRYGTFVKRTVFCSVICRLISALAVMAVSVPVALATNTQYFIDPTNASCSDTGGGTSGTPWCTLAPASSHVFGPGDQLLLANGSSFNGQTLIVQGQGAAGNPILLSSYQGHSSSTARPHIDDNGTVSGIDVLLENPSYVTVSNLEVSGAGGGVVADYNSSYSHGSVTGNQGLTFNNIYAHNITGITQGSTTTSSDYTCSATHDLWVSAGVVVTGAYTANVPSNQYGVSGVTFNDIEGEHNFDTVSTDWCDGQFGNPGGGPSNSPHPNLIQNVTVNHMYAHDGDGGGIANMCGEGFRLSGTTNALVINSRMVNLGACMVNSGTAGLILVAVTNATFANDIIVGVPNTQSNDQTAIDHEVYNDQIKLRDNLIARNAGPGTEFLSLRSNIGDYNSNNEVTGNSFYGNSVSMKHIDNASVPLTFSTPPSNNIFADTSTDSPSSDFTLGTDNVQSRLGTVPQYAADQYSSTQGFENWSYQYGGTGAWQNMTAAANQGADLDYPWNGPSSEYVSRFEQAPGSSGQPVARAWTAPASGTIAIRSRVFKSTSAGTSSVTAQITDNDQTINGTVNVCAGDQTGSEVNVDQLAVNAGDVIRFVLSGGAPSSSTDFTSWAPSITYVNAPAAATATFSDASFESPALGAGQYRYNPTGAPWTFAGKSGLASNGSGFNNPNAPNGTQVAFVQQTGSISQVINGFSPGTRYSLTFYAAQRPGNSQTLNVTIDGQLLQAITPSGTSFASYTTPTFALDNASHVIAITGTTIPDNTAFVDNIQLNATPTGLNVPNSGFETPAISSGSYQYAPISGASWTFSGNSGLASNGSGFGNPNAPQGSQVAFIQQTGSLSQSISGFSSSTSYVVGFMASQRPATSANQQGITVSIDGSPITTITPVGEGFSFYVTRPFTTTAGAHTIQLAGTQTPDETAFVDVVQVFPISATTAALANGSFESPALGAGSYAYSPATPSWLFDPRQSGREGNGILSNGSAFGNPNAPNGTQAAFFQQAGRAQSSGQRNTAASIQYCSLTMSVAPRGAQTETLSLLIDGEPVAQITPSGSSYTVWNSPGYILQPGANAAVQIVGGKTGMVLNDDNTAFVDNISTTCGR